MGNGNTMDENSNGDTSLSMDGSSIDISQDNQSDITDNTEKICRPNQFQKGNDPRRNLNGRPKGTVSPITRLKQIFEEDPDKFEKFVKEYAEDPNNRKHVVEMLDGKPKQTLAGDKDNPLRIIAVDSEEAIRYGITTSTPEDNTEGQE